MEQYHSAGIREASLAVDVLPSPTTPNPSNGANSNTTVALTGKSRRIPALDFTKGSLVLIMVLYHWLNYFVKADGSIYKYLRFLTPSFIFITGFLISHVYLNKYQRLTRHVPRRLVVRGLKLLGIALCLNLAINAVHIKGFGTRVSNWTPSDMAEAYFTGIAPVAFSVLVPIGYLLILSAGLLLVSRYYRNVYHVASAMFVTCALVFELKGQQSGYLQLLSIGMLGISLGYTPMDRINRFVKHPFGILTAYLAYLSAITFFDDVYLLQIVGVCLSLAIIYWIGVSGEKASGMHKVLILLGQYSLFAYIAQIVILQVVRSLARFGPGIGVSGAAFLTCLAGTILSVEVLDRARSRMIWLDKAYSFVFG